MAIYIMIRFIILPWDYLISQGGMAIVKANGVEILALPVSFTKWYTPYSVIRWDDTYHPNINMMCAYAGIRDNGHIYLSTDIYRSEDEGIPLAVFYLAVGV